MSAPAPTAAAGAAPASEPNKIKHGRGIVKQVMSGDSIIIRGQPKGGPPPEKQINLSNITAPRMARRANPNVEGSVDTVDEPFALEARENLRKRIIGKEIYFVVDYAPSNDRCYGTVYLGINMEGENLTELQVKEGLAEVRKVNVRADNEAHNRLIDLEEQAKAAGRGKWASPTPEGAVRDVKWTVDNPRNFVDSFNGEPIRAVIEQVRDGSMMRASLPDTHHQIQFILSGIKAPMIRRDPEDPKKEILEPYAAEAKFFVESRLLQRDVKIILEGVSNQNLLLATVLHPNGNITELLLRDGFARCVDWSITSYSQGPEKLRALEKQAKERNVRIWKDYVPKTPEISAADKNFSGKVIQILYADSIAVKLPNDVVKTVHLSSIRPPKVDDLVAKSKLETPSPSANKGRSRPLYDVPYFFEAREFMRKKLIGKKVQVSVDYIKPASTENDHPYPERTCATVTAGGVNIAEALVSKGLVKVVRHRQDDDSRSAHYDDLLAAEQRASKTGKGLYSKKEPATRHVTDVTGEQSKQLLPFLTRAGKFEAIVEYVFSGSRLRLFLPRESRLITFLLGGIDCPRPARNGKDGVMAGDAFADEAQAFTKDYCMHREVMVHVDSIDKAGSFIGWLFVDGANLSEMLVDRGLSKLHYTADRSPYHKALAAAEEQAKKTRINIWEKYEEPKEKVVVEEPVERKQNFRNVFVTEITQQLHLYCQLADNGPKLDQLMEQMRASLSAEPPLPGSYKARRGDFCVAKFSQDDMWYRARVEKVVDNGEKVHVHYIDFGNKEVVSGGQVAALPTDYNTHALMPQANEYALALVQAPEDMESLSEAFFGLCNMVGTQQFMMNTEYKDTYDHVTLVNKESQQDVGKSLIGEGLCTVGRRNEKRLAKLQSEYYREQEKAKAGHLNLWRYGDISADDATEFGYSK